MIKKTEEEISRNWNKNLPLVSIMCTTYNQEKYISQCLDGFLMQETSFPFEVIVHDDASTDKTAEIIRNYEMRYPNLIKPIYEIENQYSKHDGSLDRIIDSHLKGKYIAYCEGDDYWCDSNKLQKQFEFLESHDDYFIVGHMTKTIDINGDEIKSFINSKPGDYTLNDSNNWQLFAHFSSYFSRNYIEIIPADIYKEYLEIKCPGDRKMPILFMLYGNAFVLSEVCSVYRYQSSTTSFTSNANNRKPFKMWLEGYSLSKFAHNRGLELDFTSRQREILFWAIKDYIKGNKWDYQQILQVTNSSSIDVIKQCTDFLFYALKKRVLRRKKINEQ